MSWIRTIVAFVVALIVGVIPPELLGWLREWAVRGGSDPDESSDAAVTGKRRRDSRRRTRAN
jgi:hypothetical protein